MLCAITQHEVISLALEALLFDVDGTLADTERDGHRPAFNKAFEQAGLNWHWSVEDYGQLLAITGGKERIRHFINTREVAHPFGPELDAAIAGLHQSKTRFYTGLLAEGHIPLRTGVEHLLAEARSSGMRLAIVTTTTPANVEALLENTLGPESIGWFEVIAAGDVVPAKKPAPDIYLWAMDQMGLSPQQCLALEDSDNGVRSARDAGIASIVVTVNDYTREQDFSSVPVVLTSLGDPQHPARILQGGPELPQGFVDLNWLHSLHDQSNSA
jgi:HAD superfamily hydrolase (TIGR01509 family)